MLDDVSLEAVKGQVLGILGPNGSGKTTLLRCMNRALRPAKGTVLIDGTDYKEMSKKEIACEIGVVPQNASISFPFSVLDIVMMGRMPSLERFENETESDLEIVRKAMDRTNITTLASRNLEQISGGERQRVIIARALAQRPQIMLLDEPTLHLDVNHQLEIMDLIKQLAVEENIVVVIVSHDLGLMARYCDRLLLMKKGKIHAAGPIREVLTRESMRDVFGIMAEIDYDERIKASSVIVISSCVIDP